MMYRNMEHVCALHLEISDLISPISKRCLCIQSLMRAPNFDGMTFYEKTDFQ